MTIEETQPYLIQGFVILRIDSDVATGLLAADGIDFVLPGHVKHVSDSGTRAIKSSDDFRPRGGNERNVGFFGSSLGQRGLAGSRGTLRLRLELGR